MCFSLLCGGASWPCSPAARCAARACSRRARCAAVLWGWAAAQYPYLLPPDLTIAAGAAGNATLTAVLIVFGLAVVLVLPALGLLFTLTQRDLVAEGAAPDRAGDART